MATTIRLVCPEQPDCEGQYLSQYVDPFSDLRETVIECEKCGRFLKTQNPIDGLKLRDDGPPAATEPD